MNAKELHGEHDVDERDEDFPSAFGHGLVVEVVTVPRL